MKHIKLRRLATVLALGLSPAMALANGYHFLHQSAEGLGAAYSTNAAAINDISSMFSNPSSIARFGGTRMSGSFTVDLPTSDFTNGYATAPFSDGTVEVPGATHDDQPIDNALGAASYATHQLTDDLTLGLAIGAPYAYISEYSDQAVSRYTATRTSLQAPNISPVVAWRMNDRLSFGAALNVQYYKAGINTQIATSVTNPTVDTDLTSEISGDDLGLGFSLGMEFQVTPRTRFGASFRSAIDHDFDGELSISGSDENYAALVALAASNGVTLTSRNGSARFSISTPYMLQFGLMHQLNDKLELYANANRFGWSDFTDTHVTYDNGLTETVVDNNWNDSWFVALGMGYQYDEKIKFRAGGAYDWTPTPADTVSPRAPNNDRWNLGVGMSYAMDDHWKIDIGYQFIKFTEITIALADGNNIPRGTLDGNVNLYAHVFMVQMNYTF